jgi:hypothetical protein
MRTTVGNFGDGRPRMGGRLTLMCELYHSVAFLIPDAMLKCCNNGRDKHTSIVPIIGCFAFLPNDSCFPES